MIPQMQSGRNAALDGLRGIAAIFVMFHHSEAILGFDPVPASYLAVDLFFILSGFVLCAAYDRRLSEGGNSELNDFIGLRLIRMYPLYVIGIILGLSHFVLMNLVRESPLDIVSIAICLSFALLFLPVIGEYSIKYPNLFPLNGVSWSLFFEIAINIAYGFTARFLNTSTLSTVIAASGIWLFLQIYQHGSADLVPLSGDFLSGVPRVIFSFSVGILICRFRFRIGKLVGVGTTYSIAVFCFASFFYVFESHINVIRDSIIISIAFPLLVLGFCGHDVLGDRRRKFLLAIGETSFALYAIHLPLIGIFGGISDRVIPENFQIIAIIFIILPSIYTVSFILTRYYDEPVRGALRRKFFANRRKKKVARQA